MNLRRVLLVVLPLLVGVAVVMLWPKEKVSPEDEVRAWVGQLVDAAGKRDVATIADALAPSFKTRGGVSRQETKQMIAGLLLRSPQGVAVLNPSLTIVMESPKSGTLTGTFIFAQAGNDIGKYEITARFSKNENHWLFDSADWSR